MALLARQLIAGRFLDSGCGTGEHSLLAAEEGAVVTGVDITQAEIRAAFEDAWSVDEIEPATYRIKEVHDTTHVKAWRACLRRRR